MHSAITKVKQFMSIGQDFEERQLSPSHSLSTLLERLPVKYNFTDNRWKFFCVILVLFYTTRKVAR